jgi:hypothetical protein
VTPAEYLTARGWVYVSVMYDAGPRWRLTRANGDRVSGTEAEALALQLAEDRAVFAFVAAQSETTLVTRSPLFPDDVPHTEDVRVVGLWCEEKKP